MRLGVEAAVVRGELVSGDVEVADGLVVAVGLAGTRSGAGIAAAGFVDLQVNGYGGIDLLTDPERWREVDERLAHTGVTTWLPTLISASPEQLLAALAAIELPLHLEGPFLALPGAHPPEALRAPDLGLLRELLAAGDVAMVTLAPELPGALELVDELVGRGVVVSLGHSNADAATAHAAFDRGARAVTHLFNVMRPFSHRDPGLAGAALARSDVAVQVIADGVHLADETVLLAWRAAGARFSVVSDAIAAAGEGDGRYDLGDGEVIVRDGVARREGGMLAGSVRGLDEVVPRLVGLGLPLVDAVAAASDAPARLLGYAGLEPGAAADLVVLEADGSVVRVLRDGEPIG